MNATTAPEQNFNARKIIIALVVLVTVCVVSLIVTGVTSLISLAERIHPLAGSIVFWTLVLAAVAQKQGKGGAAYASGKTLIVFLDSGTGEWFPNRAAKALPKLVDFAAVW